MYCLKCITFKVYDIWYQILLLASSYNAQYKIHREKISKENQISSMSMCLILAQYYRCGNVTQNKFVVKPQLSPNLLVAFRQQSNSCGTHGILSIKMF